MNLSFFFRPNIYCRKLVNQKLAPDDQYALALITLQLLAGDMGISQPLSSLELLDKFQPLIQDPNMAHFYQAKLKPIIQKLFEGAITTEQMQAQCTQLQKDLDDAKRLYEFVQRYAAFGIDTPPQLVRSPFYFKFRCPYCSSDFPALTSMNTASLCPICHRKSDLPLVPHHKICRVCKNEFAENATECPVCQSQESKVEGAPETQPAEIQANDYDLEMPENLEDFAEMHLDVLPLPEIQDGPGGLTPTSITSTDKLKPTAEVPLGKRGSPSTRMMIVPEKFAAVMQDILQEMPTIDCTYQDGDINIHVKDADIGSWKFQVALDPAGKNNLEQVKYLHKQKSDIQQTIALDFEAIADATSIFVLIYQGDQLLECRKVAIEN